MKCAIFSKILYIKELKEVFYLGGNSLAKSKNDQQVILKFGENIRKIRKQHGWSQGILGKNAGMDANFIGFAERGERSITLKNIIKIQKALRCPIGELFEGIK